MGCIMDASRTTLQVYPVSHYAVSERDPRLGLGLLSVVTGVVLVLNPPMIPEFSTTSYTTLQPTTTQHVMEWRPQGPPPWGDADQFTPEEVDEAPAAVASGSAERTSGSEARARPER